MEAKAKSEFLKKISINGFSIEEKEEVLLLRPRGMESVAEIRIREKEPGVWEVTGASGRYAAFARRPKREYLESYINRWALEASLQAGG